MSSEKLISIEEFIARAKRFGVDFGTGDPKNRLRYYVKIGLLPHAQRKSFNGSPPNGAYSENNLGTLIEIDKKLKQGKSVQEIKRERETENEIGIGMGVGIETEIKRGIGAEHAPLFFETAEIKEDSQLLPKFIFKLAAFLKIGLIILLFTAITFFVAGQIGAKNIAPYFLAIMERAVKLVQLTPDDISPEEEKEEITAVLSVEPYLTINAETAINAPLSVRETITAPSIALTRDEIQGIINVAGLTAEREYNFPNLSGTVCLTAGNCVGLGGEVLTVGGTANRLTKFTAGQRVGNSSISDLYLNGVAISINSAGNVGIGIQNPVYDLHVDGKIQATGDICTDLAGGKCLSELTPPSPPIFFGGGGGIGGSGSVNNLPVWTGAATLGNSIVSQSGSILSVAGTVRMTGFQFPTNATSGYVLTSDESGFGTWQTPPTGTIPAGTAGQTLRNNGAGWLADYFLYNTGSVIGIGTTSTQAVLTVSGDGYFSGPLTISTSTLGQLILKYDDDNYLKFEIDSATAKMISSKTMVIDSLTGEVRIGDNVTHFNASNATVTAATFVSTSTDSTVRKSGEMVFRNSVPIFRFAVPAQTTSTDFVVVSKTISPSVLNATLPEVLPGAAREFAFLINFSDDILITASSTWKISGPDTEFYFTGQNSVLDQGVPHLSEFISPPGVDWQLEVKAPLSENRIRIFNILLLVYDKIN